MSQKKTSKTYKPWKRLERKVAKDLGTTRVLAKGRSAPDVVVKLTSMMRVVIDCKHRKSLALKQSLEKCRSYCVKMDVAAICYQCDRVTSVFMYLFDLLSLMWAGGIVSFKQQLQAPLIVSLTYKDFVSLVRKAKER